MLPPPPYVRETESFTNRKPEPKRNLTRALLVVALVMWSLVVIVRVATVFLYEDSPKAVAAPEKSHVPFDPKPLTQAGADAATGAVLVAWHDVDHLRFVMWDVHRLTGCRALAFRYTGPGPDTDPHSVPEDIDPTVVGKAHTDNAMMEVWWKC